MNKAIAYLRSPATIRSHCHQLLNLARENKLFHFQFCEEHFGDVVAYVMREINANYPDHTIPYHSRFRHFEVGGIDRVKELQKLSPSQTPQEKAITLFELAIISVLLDAGAGETWRYREKNTGKVYTRSEGLAVASVHMFQDGLFSLDASSPLRVDAEALLCLSQEQLTLSLQVTDDNPLIGLEGRTTLLNRLGKEIKKQPHFFGDENCPRLGGLCTYLLGLSKDGQLSAKTILDTVLRALSNIWPKGYHIEGINLGDVGCHRLAKGAFDTDGLVPFHKLSQWLAYSLFEPLEVSGLTITGTNDLTGLPEYRNGGLLIDAGLLQLREKKAALLVHAPQSELIVEWRALTLALLDLIGEEVRKALGKTEDEFPLVKVLQGGTWSAGRRIAREMRANGTPPLCIKSDGTVF